MKKTLMMFLLGAAATPAAFAQTKMPNDPKVEAQLIALEKAGWEAWKNNDATWPRNNMTEDFIMVMGDGTRDKAAVLKATPKECVVKSYALANFKLVMLDANVVLLTYTASQQAVCAGKAIPTKVRASVNYVKRGGKWLEAFYMEKPME